ncbi:hypothetical protein [Micromonospora purpureochromogenes]|uniref:Lipoprotein LprG n=1 Tax=Micromonospora purpureochromogenes TaxID=47872 RepID=A0ABX2RKX6_9ACTN|nr:hypothetical protein [Micromonospora purpureochromogenes]NYF56770.1 hypothetical protein [Micromonospora purpureochromogenes]
MRLRACAAGAVLLAFIAGCTEEAPKPSAEVVAVDAALAKLRASRSYVVEFDLEITIGVPTAKLVGEGRYRSGDEPASAVTAEVSNSLRPTRIGDFALTNVDGVRYARSTAIRTPAGRPWVRLAGDEKSESRYALAVAWLPPTDPLLWLDLMWRPDRGSSKQFYGKGSERVGDLPTTHYIGSCRSGVGCAGPQLAAWLERNAPETAFVNVGVWIDGDGQIRRFSANSILGLDDGSSYQFSIRAVVRDHGARVQVEPPPAGQVVDAAAIPKPSA